MKILISYKITIGIDIIIRLIGSGGVIIADNITVIIIASLLYFLKKSGAFQNAIFDLSVFEISSSAASAPVYFVKRQV